MTATKIQPGDDTHLTSLMAPHSLNFVTGADRAALLAYGRDVFAAARDSKCLAQIEEPAQPIAGYRISDPSDPTIKPWLSDTPDDNGYTSEPLYAGAAPAAVAPFGYVNTHTGQFFKDVEPCRQGNEGHWRTVYLQPSAVAGAAPAGWQLVPATPTREWIASVADGGYEDCDCASLIADILSRAPAAPALEAPAAPAPAVPDDWRLVPANPTDAMLGAAQKAWLADPLRRSSTLYAAALAAAPQAPRLGEVALHLLRRLLSNQHTLTGPEFRAELEKIVAEESARHAAAPQAPAAPSGRYELADDGAHQYLDGIEARYSIEREDGTTLAWVNGDKAAAEELMAALRLPMPISRSEWIAEVRSFLCQGGWDEDVALSTARDLCEAQDWLGQDIEEPRDAAWDAFREDIAAQARRAAPAAPAVDTEELGEWVATLEVDSEGGLDYETVPPCTLPPGCYRLYRAAQAKEGGEAC